MNQQPQGQQSQPQDQQTTMHEAPNVFTGKDLNYINDIMAWNLTASKKAHFFAQHCQDAEIKQAIDTAGQMHQRHYEQFLQLLNQPQNQPPTYQ
ncbi:hypothetical protein [Shouchella patagoniensis]|uniref:hypothetical protein n=1 Tax=Shouchella patagoniensis TaxID=228576 RepID=UPI0009956B8D|nr:hypothetical protein [Shouchella patagoniensis]